nr:hypothetical protein [Tanacetum cinerariifolium]
ILYGNTYTLCRVIIGVRHAQLVDTDIESDLEEASSEAEESQPLGSRVSLMSLEFEASEPSRARTISSHSLVSLDSIALLSPDHPLTHVSPTPTPTRVLFHRRTVRMVVRTQPTLSSGMSAQIAEAAALSPSSFCKRYRSSYETSSSSSLNLPAWKRYRERESQGLDDDGQGSEDEDPGIEEEEAAPEGQQQAVLVVDTAMDEPLDLGYGGARRRPLESIKEIAPSTYEVGQSSRSVPEQEGAERVSAYRQPTLVTWVDPEDDRVYTHILTYVPLAAPVQTPSSPEWLLGSLPVSSSSPVVPSPIASSVATSVATISVDEDQFLEVWTQLELYRSILHDHTQRLDTLPRTLFEGYDRDLMELYTRSGEVRDEIFSQRENHDLRRQLAVERRERLELTDHVARMDKRQESGGETTRGEEQWELSSLAVGTSSDSGNSITGSGNALLGMVDGLDGMERGYQGWCLVCVGNKMHKAFPLPVMEFPLSEEVPTASEESSHCQKKRDATAEKIVLLPKLSSNCQSKSYDSYAKLVPHLWSTARIETTEEGTKILATVDGNLRTMSESSIRRNLKLNDEAGISSLPDAELFENLQLMGYNILPNQKFTFQKGQFSLKTERDWEWAMNPGSIGFNSGEPQIQFYHLIGLIYDVVNLNLRNIRYRDVKFYETVFPYKMNTNESVNKSSKISTTYFLDHYEFEPTTNNPLSLNDHEEGTPGRDGRVHHPEVGANTDQDRYDKVHSATPIVEEVGPRRSQRSSKLPTKMNDFLLDSKVKYGLNRYANRSVLSPENYCFVSNLNKCCKPSSYEEALKDLNWVNAMNDEMYALFENKTWFMIDLPIGRKPTGCK